MSNQTESPSGCCSYPAAQIGHYLTVPSGILLVVTGALLLLSAYFFLPPGLNVISDLRNWSCASGCLAAIIGAFLTAYGVWKLFPQKQVINNRSISNNSIEQEIEKGQRADTLSSSNGWKKGLGKNETHQTFHDFETLLEDGINAQRNCLKVTIINDISQNEQKILHIVCAYLAIMYNNMPLTLKIDNLLSASNKRQAENEHHDQYAIEPNLSILEQNSPNDAFVLGFTNQDLYPFSVQNMNFAFGVSRRVTGSGLFSTFRYSGSNSEVMLKRLMKLAIHEFSHMRGIKHCTQFVCCMQGTNNMSDADKVPLTFCAEDMAKICHLNHWTLKEGYQKQLEFFENFESRYQMQVDFSEEIKHLKQKISALQ